MSKVIILFIDDTPIEMPSYLIYERPKLSGQLWIEWSLLVTPDLVTRLEGARKIGSGISPGAPIFSGFSGIELGSGKDRLSKLFGQCNNDKYSHRNSGSPAQLSDNPADIALATRPAHNLDREYQKGGMMRLRQSVEECYKMVRSHPIVSSIEYCYILDQISCGLDEAFWRNMGKPQQDEFWKRESGTARTSAVLASVNAQANSYEDALSQWETTKNAALQVMLSMRH